MLHPDLLETNPTKKISHGAFAERFSTLQARRILVPNFPMKTKQNSFARASAVQITFISLLAMLLTLGAAPARNFFAESFRLLAELREMHSAR